jgi:deoxycytidine triphosphate deaminase
VTPVAPAFSSEPLGAVLCDSEIRRLVEDHGLITGFREGSLQPASYDLALGREYFTQGAHRMLNDDGDVRSITLESGQFVLVTSTECLKVPDDVVGHAGLVSKWAQRGLISFFSPQIDPGFQGLIVVPLFNAGNAPVTLSLGERVFTVEFVRMTGPTSTSWSDRHEPLMNIPSGVEMKMASPDLKALSDRVTTLEGMLRGEERKLARSGVGAAWWAVIIALAALLVAGAGIALPLLLGD